MTNRDKQIGETIRLVRGSMSQEALASKMVSAGHVKWSQSTVWAVEKGTRPLRLSEAASLAAVLEIPTVDELTGSKDEVWARLEIRHLRDAGAAAGVAARRLEQAQGDFRLMLRKTKWEAGDFPEYITSLLLPVDRFIGEALANTKDGEGWYFDVEEEVVIWNPSAEAEDG